MKMINRIRPVITCTVKYLTSIHVDLKIVTKPAPLFYPQQQLFTNKLTHYPRVIGKSCRSATSVTWDHLWRTASKISGDGKVWRGLLSGRWKNCGGRNLYIGHQTKDISNFLSVSSFIWLRVLDP